MGLHVPIPGFIKHIFQIPGTTLRQGITFKYKVVHGSTFKYRVAPSRAG